MVTREKLRMIYNRKFYLCIIIAESTYPFATLFPHQTLTFLSCALQFKGAV